MKTLFTDATGFVPELNGSILNIKGVSALSKELDQKVIQARDLYEVPTKFKDFANELLKDRGIPYLLFITSYPIVRAKQYKEASLFSKLSKSRVYRLYWRTTTEKTAITDISKIHESLNEHGFNFEALWLVNVLEYQRLIIDTKCSHFIYDFRTAHGLLEKMSEIPVPPMKPDYLFLE